MRDRHAKESTYGTAQAVEDMQTAFLFRRADMLTAAYLIGESYQWRGNDVSVFFWIAAGIGILIMAGGLLTAFSKLRCPYCGASLMAGGRMPSSLPHFCPDCGKTLDDCD